MIKHWPDDSLKKICIEVEHFNEELHNILDEMTSVMEEQNGLGIASNQLGFDRKIFLIKLKNDDILEIINPIVISEIGEQYEKEGCLSFEGIFRKIKRPKYVHAKWQNRKGEFQEGVFADYEAVCFSHENEHLYGKTILDNLNRKDRKALLKEMGL